MRFYLPIAILLCMISNIAHASAWLQKQYHGKFSITNGGYFACKVWTRQNVLKKEPCYKLYNFEPYFEYGLFPWLTLIVDSFFQTYGQDGFSRPFNLQNITFSLKPLVWENENNVVALQVSYNQPFQPHVFLTGIIYTEETIPSPLFLPDQEKLIVLLSEKVPTDATAQTRASLEKNLDLRVLYGIRSSNIPSYNGWYADTSFGYQKYFQGAADQFHFDWEAGFQTVKKKLTLEFQNFNVISLRNAKNELYPDYDLIAFAFNIYYDFYSFLNASIGVEQTIYGRNIGQATSPYATISFYF